MSSPIFLINDYINKYPDLENLRNELYKKNILSKDYIEEGLLLIYHKYDQPNNTDLERECRSIIIDRNTKKILSYSCETPVMNTEAVNYLLLNQNIQKTITKCYEGTLLSLFFKDKWYISTRRCLNSNDSVWGSEQKSHYNMFMDILNKSGFETMEKFTDNLDKDLCYYFVLIHHQNKHLVDYQTEFGKDYMKLVLVFLRNKETLQELDLYNQKLDLSKILGPNIFISPKIENLEEFDATNQQNQFLLPPSSEGIIIKTNNNKLIKLQTKSYQFAKSIGTEKNIFIGLIHLYQKDKLLDYINEKKNINLKKIVNPLNTTEAYDSIGLIDSLFKVCTSEIFELFKNLWDIKTGKHSNGTLYNLLPKEYKDILFAVRGLYFKKKAEATFLQIKDVYQMFKNMPTENFCALIRMRKLMYNWCKINNKLIDFSKISSKCDKIHIKLTAIYCNKLFPNITKDDLPNITKDDLPNITKDDLKN